ncbi:MAG: valine--tRNA ligase [Candidatus Diapherotrites archaeon]|nr:valine--tRNA ligase [Candidatus Diapherotrites archaeon]
MRLPIQATRWGKEQEEKVLQQWTHAWPYRLGKAGLKKRVFSIDTPPPYVNAPIHIGQATTYVLMDMFARFHRMRGKTVLFPLGLDNNGLPIEVAAEKKFNVRMHETPREQFIQYCKQLLQEAGSATLDSLHRLGVGFNSYEKGTGLGEVYETDSPEYRALTQSIFIDLWKRGLIYEDERINNYCPGCHTTIADSEMDYIEKETAFNYVKFKVQETGESILIATTRPELIASCGMIIFAPEDERFKHLKGKHALTPVYERVVPIQPHSFAKSDKGSGLVMMCSAGDTTDIRFYREMGLKPVISIDQQGRMNAHAGFLQGLKVKEAREKMIETLREKELLAEQKKVLHRTPICERSKHDIEFISMREYYVKQLEFKKDLKALTKKIKFYDESSRQILLDWIESVSIDWPVSRRRYYATEVPLWYCTSCGGVIAPEKGKYYQPWKDAAPVKKCPTCEGTAFKGDERVLDTWFDSSNSVFYINRYEKDSLFFKKNFPCSLRPQGKEIVRTWLYYTLLKGLLLTKKPAFNGVWVNHHIVDEKGNKMSKSVGNIINPGDVLQRFGAEPFRLWATLEGNLEKTDFRCSFERMEGAGKTITKLWNVARFISLLPEPKGAKKLGALDKQIIQEVHALAWTAFNSFDQYDFHTPMAAWRHFLWENFASQYVELVKARAQNADKKFSTAEQQGALYALNHCLDLLLRIAAPVNPFITQELYAHLFGKDIHAQLFPKGSKQKDKKSSFSFEELAELNGMVWKAKKEKGLSLRDPLKVLHALKKFKSIEKDLKACHNAQEVKWGTENRAEL